MLIHGSTIKKPTLLWQSSPRHEIVAIKTSKEERPAQAGGDSHLEFLVPICQWIEIAGVLCTQRVLINEDRLQEFDCKEGIDNEFGHIKSTLLWQRRPRDDSLPKSRQVDTRHEGSRFDRKQSDEKRSRPWPPEMKPVGTKSAKERAATRVGQ